MQRRERGRSRTEEKASRLCNYLVLVSSGLPGV